MSTSLEGLRLFMKTVIDSEPHIMQPLERIAWKESVCPEYSQHQKLRVAVMSNDGVVQPHPPVTRALLEVVSKLRKLNWIELIEWKPYRHDEACKFHINPHQQSMILRLLCGLYSHKDRENHIHAILPRRRHTRTLID